MAGFGGKAAQRERTEALEYTLTYDEQGKCVENSTQWWGRKSRFHCCRSKLCTYINPLNPFPAPPTLPSQGKVRGKTETTLLKYQKPKDRLEFFSTSHNPYFAFYFP